VKKTSFFERKKAPVARHACPAAAGNRPGAASGCLSGSGNTGGAKSGSISPAGKAPGFRSGPISGSKKAPGIRSGPIFGKNGPSERRGSVLECGGNALKVHDTAPRADGCVLAYKRPPSPRERCRRCQGGPWHLCHRIASLRSPLRGSLRQAISAALRFQDAAASSQAPGCRLSVGRMCLAQWVSFRRRAPSPNYPASVDCRSLPHSQTSRIVRRS